MIDKIVKNSVSNRMELIAKAKLVYSVLPDIKFILDETYRNKYFKHYISEKSFFGAFKIQIEEVDKKSWAVNLVTNQGKFIEFITDDYLVSYKACVRQANYWFKENVYKYLIGEENEKPKNNIK